LGIENIKIADIIIFRTRWSKVDLDQIENLVTFLKKLNKKNLHMCCASFI